VSRDSEPTVHGVQRSDEPVLARSVFSRPSLDRILVRGAILLAAAGAPRFAEACAVCFGDPDSAQATGVNRAILLLLGLTFVVLASFGAFFLRLRRLGRLHADSTPEGASTGLGMLTPEGARVDSGRSDAGRSAVVRERTGNLVESGRR
jgi:hypothetical protein